MSDNVPLHERVAALLDEVLLSDDGPALPERQVESWLRGVRVHPEREEIAVQVLVLARRFAASQADALVGQLVAAVATLIGEERARRLVEGAPLPPRRREGEHERASGLARPTGGVGLRKPTR